MFKKLQSGFKESTVRKENRKECFSVDCFLSYEARKHNKSSVIASWQITLYFNKKQFRYLTCPREYQNRFSHEAVPLL